MSNLPQKIDFYACKYDYYPQKYSTKMYNLEMLTDGDNKEDDYVKQWQCVIVHVIYILIKILV